MSRPVEEIPLEDVNPDDEYESTVGDTTGAVGGTSANTDFGGGQIQTPVDRSSVRRRGSIEWENDITQEDVDNVKKITQDIISEEELANRLRDLGKDRITDLNASLLNEQLSLDKILEINTTLSRRWKEYVVEKLNRKFELEGGGTFKRGTVWSITDKGIFVEYDGNKTRITAAGNPRKFLAPSTISKNYGLGGTAFVRDTLGVVDYSSGSKKTQRQAEKAYTSAKMFHS